MDNVDNSEKSYPHKKPSKIKGFKKLSTMESELSTSYPQSYPQFFGFKKLSTIDVDNFFGNFEFLVQLKKLSTIFSKLWITLMWITLSYQQ